jgi:hypothetical protein
VKVKGNSLTGSDVNEATLAPVPQAITAGNALALGGKSASQLIDAAKLRCPAGMQIAAGLCFEAETRPPAAIAAAINICAADDRRLPTEGELLAFGFKYLTGETPHEWVEPEYYDGSEWRETVVAPSSDHEEIASTTTGAFSYRCVTMPSN